MEFLVLGPLEVRVGGQPLRLGGAKQRAALAILLLHRNRVVSQDTLVDGLWGDRAPASSTATLYAYISRLRRLLHADGRPERLVTRSPGYMLQVDDGELDLQRLEALLGDGRRALATGQPAPAAEALNQGLALFRGTPLADLADLPFARSQIDRLEELRLAALEQRVEADLALGRHDLVIGELFGLVAEHPFRERFWAELMLALYRAGRRGEALNAFDRCRRTLAEQLGMEPGEQLQRLHRQLLEGDPALGRATPHAPPAATDERASGRRTSRRRRVPRMIAAVAVTALVVISLAVGLSLRERPPRTPHRTTYQGGTVLLDLRTGRQIGFISPARLATAAYPIFAGDHFWVADFEPAAFVEIDPHSGGILKQITPPARDPAIHGDPVSLTPFAVQGNALWTTSGDDLVQISVNLGREIQRLRLDRYAGGAGIAEGVALGAGSIWLSRDVGRGQILRLDPATGRVQHRFDDMVIHDQLTFGDGALWISDENGVARIDPTTNLVTRVDGVDGTSSIVAGGRLGWASDPSKGVVYAIDGAGRVAATYDVGIGAGFMAYADGRLMVGATDPGTVTAIDPTTGRKATYRFGHPVDTVTAGRGVLLTQLEPGPTVESFFASLPENTARLFANPGELGEGGEPALDTHRAAYQIEYATCAKLLNYPDAPPPRGWQLRPEVAERMPTLSRDRRTYRFVVRPGYRFSPPSNQPVTAETFRYSIERALSPKLAQYPYPLVPPGPDAIDDIDGERAFRHGTADHIRGLRVDGNTLSITLARPSPDFLERLALPYFCPVPIGTPIVPGAPRLNAESPTGGSIEAAGPYYVADFNNGRWVILQRNPNYHGPRPHRLDAIAIREGVDAAAAVNLVETGRWDGITHLTDPLLDPGGAVDQRWGAGTAGGHDRYLLAPEADTGLLAFNARHGLFADPRVRRAASLALDRQALAAVWGELPTARLLPPVLPGGQDEAQGVPPAPLVSRARALMRGRTGHALMPVPAGCDRCDQFARVVQTDLAAIGIDVRLRTIQASVDDAPRAAKRFDMAALEARLPYPDSPAFLEQVLHGIPRQWVQPEVSASLDRAARAIGDHRQTLAADLARSITTRDVVVAPYGMAQTSQFLSSRLGCQVLPPVGFGVDLAALCLVPT